MISFDKVTLGYGRCKVLEELTFKLEEGDYLGLIGPNGSGKTTLLRALMGILAPLKGKISYRQGPRMRRFGYVPQRMTLDELYPLRVKDIVMMGRFPYLGVWRRPKPSDRTKVEQSLERVGMWDKALEPFASLSGGQKQRVLIARALALEPELLFLDEPTNGMDLASEESVMELVGELYKQGMTVVLVTHLLALVARHAKKVGIIHNGLTLGEADQVLTSEKLSSIYGRPVDVIGMGSHRFVVAGSSKGEARAL